MVIFHEKEKDYPENLYCDSDRRSVLIMTMVLLSTLWASRQIISSTDEAVSAVSSFYLKAMADRRAKTITNLISNNFYQMEAAIDVIRDEEIETEEELRAMVGKITSLLSLSRLALVDEDNIVYTQYTTYTGGSRHEFLAQDQMDERIVNTVYLYGSSKQLCLAVPTTDLTILGKPFKACFVQIDINDIVELLAFDDYDRTSFGLYSKNGGNLSDTELRPYIRDQNLFDAMKDVVPPREWDALCDDFLEEKEGSLTFVTDGIAETLCYVPVPDTGWETVVLIRESVIRDQIHGISENNLAVSRKQIILVLLSMLVFAVILLLMARKIARDKLEAEQENSRNFRSMANTDSMTGVRNKHAYSEAELSLNRKIHENEIGNLAVVVCDINGLKYVNDTQGHAAGDKLIKDASNMICEYFPHGAVYRIGGDEFVVLLQGKGYDMMHETINDLNRRIEANIAEHAVVIAIGYSTLGTQDEQLRDVFERADQMMYERKKQLKEMGARTRE
ncbi:MAG: GGDEF domain-containing protein [Lachnospiraceae bacterium]|nr:GGDEF domain-containing protein [Lachnospiraceae bacterium]